jgi:DNA-binding transcriptional LysR family regulator
MALVSAEQGVALVPGCMQRVGMNGVVFVPLRGTQQAMTPAVMAWRADQPAAVLDAFIERVKAMAAVALKAGTD